MSAWQKIMFNRLDRLSLSLSLPVRKLGQAQHSPVSFCNSTCASRPTHSSPLCLMQQQACKPFDTTTAAASPTHSRTFSSNDHLICLPAVRHVTPRSSFFYVKHATTTTHSNFSYGFFCPFHIQQSILFDVSSVKLYTLPAKDLRIPSEICREFQFPPLLDFANSTIYVHSSSPILFSNFTSGQISNQKKSSYFSLFNAFFGLRIRHQPLHLFIFLAPQLESTISSVKK